MTRRFTQWGLFTGMVGVAALLALLLIPETVIDVAEPLLNPWLDLCRAVTPGAWQVQGNILLGLMWLISGVVVYSMLIGAAGVGALSLIERRSRPVNPPENP